MLFSFSVDACPCGFYIYTPARIAQGKREYESHRIPILIFFLPPKSCLHPVESNKDKMIVFDLEMAVRQ